MSAESLAIADLARSGLTLAQAEAAGMFAVESAQEEPYETDFKPLPSLIIPYYDPRTGDSLVFSRQGARVPFVRVRYLADPPAPKGFCKRKPQRYSQPRGSGPRAYFPHGANFDWREIVADSSVPILITEGEKKALSACLAGVPTIGLGGVDSFASGGALIDDLAGLVWEDRQVFICYDSDAASNANIQAAEGRLTTELSLRRRANVFVARLPNLPKQDKTGIDDFLVAKGADAFLEVLRAAPQPRKIDSAVLGLNKSVAWIERDGAIYDIEHEAWIKKSDFANGSRFAALEIQVPNAKGDGLKRLSVAEEFLKHPLARRYSDVIFDPHTDSNEKIDEQGRAVLNMWRGWEPGEGDVTPFLDLSAHLFSDLPEDVRDLPLNLLAYKAQNPGHKVPLALVLLGQQGCGKSLWSRIVREAFAPYGAAVSPKALVSDFNGWCEKALVVVLDEARGVDVVKGAETLKSLISETKTYLNEKYRVARQVDSYAMYILTSNDPQVGAYSGDDRRMFVIGCPPKREHGFYLAILRWLDAGGAKKVLGWLLSRDLKDWRPPAFAPMTHEKYLAYAESLTPVQRLAEDMRTADENVVKAWIDSAMMWANANLTDTRTTTRAQEIKNSLSRLQIRPFYTSEELAMMFPAIVAQMQGVKTRFATAGEISSQLRACGIPALRNSDDPRGFRWRGMLRQYLIVAAQDEWRAPISQDEFEMFMANFPDYGTTIARQGEKRR